MTDTSWKELWKNMDKTTREFRLKNLKRAAEKNQILCKIAKRNMIQACVRSFYCLHFIWNYFYLHERIWPCHKNCRKCRNWICSLFGLLSSIKTLWVHQQMKMVLKFSEIDDEIVELSLKTTDEDDVKGRLNIGVVFYT